MKLLVRTISTSIVFALGTFAAWLAANPSNGSASLTPAEVREAPAPEWRHPDWFPDDTFLDGLPALSERGPRRGPSIRAASAIVYDVDAGEVLYEKNADDIRPIASLTKVVSALALMSTAPDLDTAFCIGPQHYPTRSGARSHLSTGDCLWGWDVLGAALVASDNRGAYGLVSTSGLDMDDFLVRMNEVASELGMNSSSFTDPSGLEDENLSTARDMARATLAAAAHPVLSVVASSPWWDVLRTDRPPRRLFTTNRLIARTDLDFDAAKTGYTDTARYCYTGAFTTSNGRHLVVTLLGAEGKQTRWADVNRILKWLGEKDQEVTVDSGQSRPKATRHRSSSRSKGKRRSRR